MSMSIVQEKKNRSRGHQCKRCGKIMRKANLVGHIQKQHLALDQVPYWCALCSIRCRTKEELVEHVNSYDRHLEEEEKLARLPNYAEIFRRSENPYIVGDDDMVVLTKEETQKWRRREAINALENGDVVSEEEEEDDGEVERDEKIFPSWAVGIQRSNNKLPKSDRPPQMQTKSRTRPGVTPHLTGNISSIPSTPATMPPVTSTLTYAKAMAAATAPVVSASVTAVPLSMPEVFGTINADDWANTFTLTGEPSGLLQTLAHVTPKANVQAPAPSGNNPLNTPHLGVPQQPRVIIPSSTPCRYENILHDLLGNDSVGNLAEELGIRELPEEEEEPTPKRQKKTHHPQPQLDAITRAITEGFAKVAKALDDNTRAIRCQEKTSAKAVEELKRIERKLTQMDRTLAEKDEDKPRRPVLQSLVNRMH